ncbi:MAG: carbohydrate ABC transporter permease [Deinococcales bacterium]
MRTRIHLAPWGFLAPALVLYALFALFPMLRSMQLSLERNIDGEVRFAGLAQYTRLLEDDILKQALFNTFIFLFLQTPIMLTLALLLAIALNSKRFPYRALLRGAYFLPSIMSLVAVGVLFRVLLNEDLGAINYFLRSVGLEGVAWVSHPWWAKVTVMLLLTWRYTGFMMVVYLAGLQGIPDELYEAAEIDGSSRGQSFWYITLPLLRPTILFTTVLSTIGVLQIFDEALIVTRGGPANETLTISLYLYQTAFGSVDFHYAAAISWFLVLLIGSLSIIQLRFGER